MHGLSFLSPATDLQTTLVCRQQLRTFRLQEQQHSNGTQSVGWPEQMHFQKMSQKSTAHSEGVKSTETKSSRSFLRR